MKLYKEKTIQIENISIKIKQLILSKSIGIYEGKDLKTIVYIDSRAE